MTLTFAYADPPYIGCSKLYPEHPDAAKWDNPNQHKQLMKDINDGFDGWALSCHEPSLQHLAPVAAVMGARIAVWVKPFAAYKANVRVAYTWEPVIWKRTAERREDEPVGRDHLSCPITLRKGLTGAKPEAFCRWLQVLWGWLPGDEIVDIFPGTGVMGRVADELRLM